jgi:hypothetical protein
MKFWLIAVLCLVISNVCTLRNAVHTSKELIDTNLSIYKYQMNKYFMPDKDILREVKGKVIKHNAIDHWISEKEKKISIKFVSQEVDLNVKKTIITEDWLKNNKKLFKKLQGYIGHILYEFSFPISDCNSNLRCYSVNGDILESFNFSKTNPNEKRAYNGLKTKLRSENMDKTNNLIQSALRLNTFSQNMFVTTVKELLSHLNLLGYSGYQDDFWLRIKDLLVLPISFDKLSKEISDIFKFYDRKKDDLFKNSQTVIQEIKTTLDANFSTHVKDLLVALPVNVERYKKEQPNATPPDDNGVSLEATIEKILENVKKEWTKEIEWSDKLLVGANFGIQPNMFTDGIAMTMSDAGVGIEAEKSNGPDKEVDGIENKDKDDYYKIQKFLLTDALLQYSEQLTTELVKNKQTKDICFNNLMKIFRGKVGKVVDNVTEPVIYQNIYKLKSGAEKNFTKVIHFFQKPSGSAEINLETKLYLLQLQPISFKEMLEEYSFPILKEKLRDLENDLAEKKADKKKNKPPKVPQ